MYREENDGLATYHFDSFDPNLVNHAFYTRLGGVSEGPYSQLNLGGTNGDKHENVRANHLKLFKILVCHLKAALMFGRSTVTSSISQMLPDPRPRSTNLAMVSSPKTQM
jgi:hypothetical protein